jgi:hypothetical protein
MDYSKGYFNATSMAQRIRENTHYGKKTSVRGLASRDDTTQEYPDAGSLSAKYIANIQGMFTPDPAYTDQGNLKSYLSGLEEKNSLQGLKSPSAGTEGHMSKDFLSKLIASESSGNASAVHKTKDGRVYGGLVQLGEARIEDYNKATNSTIEMADILTNKDIQKEVIDWHLADLGTLADKLSAETGLDRAGLIAVGHLGGRTGMANFAASGGKYNPSDELGTSLLDYYTRFKN